MPTDDERKKQRIEYLLEKHNLHVKWYMFCLVYCFHVEDGDGNYLWGGSRSTVSTFRNSILHFLEKYDRGE
jgi:hypothetical protein